MLDEFLVVFRHVVKGAGLERKQCGWGGRGLETCGCGARAGKISQIPAAVGGVKFCGCEAGADKRFQLAQHCKAIQAQLYVPLDVLSLIRNDCREPHVIDRLLSVDQWAIIVHCGTQSQTTLLLQSSASKYVIFICLVHSEKS